MKLHQFLSDYRDELVDACARTIQRDVPSHGDDEVGPYLGDFITDVARVLRGAEGQPEGRRASEVAPADLARDRHRRGFQIEDLVPTYASLSQSVGEVGGQHNLDFSAAEYGLFNKTIDEHIAEAIEEFADVDHREQEAILGQRLGFLAHELRNALQSASMAFLILESGKVGVQGRTAQIVRRNLDRMGTLIHRSLVDARATADATPGLHPVALLPVLRDIEASAVLERGIQLTVDADEHLEVLADEDLLTSAVGNLVQNGIKFSHDGATVVLRVARDAAVAVIEVRDACGGLPPGKADDLFEPFVQRARDRRGAGLGLTIARNAVLALSGEISARDVPGTGCVFSIRLPLPPSH